MKIIHEIGALKSVLKHHKMNGKTVGFVPTMGFFHEGHLSLMKYARKKSDVVVVSLFVNPTQFGPSEDFDAYPRNLDRDMDLCNSVGVDYMFVPEVLEMYPEGYATYVTVESDMTNQLCGASRPGHFKGVATVVTKLFNIVEPDFAFFGQKDAQQVSVLKRMCKDLNSSVEIIACPIVRESDGLAMSSRNVYLSQSERQDALVLYKALSEAERLIRKGQRGAIRVKNTMVEIIESVSTSKIDYVEIVSATTLKPVETITEDTLIALAVKIGKTRLIDNLNVDFL